MKYAVSTPDSAPRDDTRDAPGDMHAYLGDIGCKIAQSSPRDGSARGMPTITAPAQSVNRRVANMTAHARSRDICRSGAARAGIR